MIIELKAVERLMPIHEAQLLSYLKLSGKRLGLLINFHVLRVKDGYKRIVNDLYPSFLCALCVLCGERLISIYGN